MSVALKIPPSKLITAALPVLSLFFAPSLTQYSQAQALNQSLPQTAQPVSAPATGKTSLPLSLKRAVEIALAPDGNTRVALAQESIQQAADRVTEAKSAFLPHLDVAISDRYQTTNLKAYGFAFNIPVPGFTIPSLVGPFSVLDARATAQQSVLNFADLGKYKATKATLSATKSDADTTRTQISDEVAHDYLASLRADAVRDTARANLELSQALLDSARRVLTAGTGTGIEVTRAEVQLANDRQLLIQAENARTRTVLVLLRAMNLTMDSPIEFTSKLNNQPVDSKLTEAESAGALIAQARAARPELKTQQQREQVASLNYNAVKSERLPSIGASADYGAIGTDIVSARSTYTLGVTLRVPVFDGFRRRAQNQESFSQFHQEQLRTKDLAQQIELQVRVALESLRSAKAEVDAAREGLALAENELAQARRRYEAGVAISVEVTDAQTRLQRARDNQVMGLYDFNVAQLDLATATGTIGDYINQ